MRHFSALRWMMIVFFLVGRPYVAHGGPERDVRTDGWMLGQEDVARMLWSRLESVIDDPKKRIEIRDLRTEERVPLPPGALSHEVVLPEQAYRGGPLSATVVLSINGQEKKRLRVSARVDLYAEVVVARHPLKKHQELQDKDVQVVERNVAMLPGDIVTDLKDVLTRRTTLSVNGQEVFRKGMVEVPPLVRKGDRVMMAAESRQFKITTWGEAKDEGRRGDRIRLVNLSSKKEVFGRVLDANTVRIDY